VFTRTGSDFRHGRNRLAVPLGRGYSGTDSARPSRDRRAAGCLQDGTSESSNSRAPSQKILDADAEQQNAIPARSTMTLYAV